MYTLPKVISPFYGDIRIPRKLKKLVKAFNGIHWVGLDNGQRLWYYLEHTNNDYKQFIINHICKH